MAGQADADQQLLRQPVPDPGAVLCAGHSCVDNEARRSDLRRDGMALRIAARCACLYPHYIEPRTDAVQGFRRGHVRAAADVDHLRSAHPARASMTPAARLSAAIEIL